MCPMSAVAFLPMSLLWKCKRCRKECQDVKACRCKACKPMTTCRVGNSQFSPYFFRRRRNGMSCLVMKDKDEDGGVLPPRKSWRILSVMMSLASAASRKLTRTLSLFFCSPQIFRILYRRWHGWSYLIIILISYHP